VSLLIGTFVFSVASALIPVLNLEVYLGAVAARAPHVSQWELAVLAGSGQMVGKLIWYYAGVNTMKLPWMRRKMGTEKWRASYETWHGRIVGRPVYAGVICVVAGFGGFPPFAVIAVLAGSLGMNVWVFLTTGLLGRILRFWAVLAGVGLLFGH
jgi:membrane protein YqaA with SNARE-associated domain